MPELPEVETVRRMLERHVRGRTVATARASGLRLRLAIAPTLPRRLRGRTLERVGRHGKYLLLELDRGLTLVSHLGMSGRWLFDEGAPLAELPHVHLTLRLRDGSTLRFQDPRRFGLLKLVPTERVFRDPLLASLGPDPVASPPSAEALERRARGMRLAVKGFLLDQRRIAGIGNIYASEILHRAGIDPRRPAGSLDHREWVEVAASIPIVLDEATAGMGTTFSAYRTLWNEAGSYGERLRVYDRAGEPCRSCGGPVRRIVQAQRSTYFCPACQPRRPKPRSGKRLRRSRLP